MSLMEESLMFMVADSLRIGVVTGHIPIANVELQLLQKRF